MTAATLMPAIEVGSARWLGYMTASKIAAAMGLSTYESPFSLWHRMAGQIAPDPETDMTRRGHYLEPAIRAWFADQHPEFRVLETGTWVNDERTWQAASPDALAYVNDVDSTGQWVGVSPVALCEFKSAHEDDHWGQPGTDDIPVHYRCQVMWQMDTTGVHTCYVALLSRHLEFVEYVVHWNEDEARTLRDAGADFMASIEANERPDIDSHSQTYAAIRQLHPLIDQEDVELDGDTARAYCAARAALKTAEDRERLTKSLVADAIGNARRARYDGHTIAQRQAKGLDGVPYLVAGRNLPDLTTEEATA